MPKSYKYATPICLVLSILTLIGIIIGIVKSSPLIIIIFLLPTVIYEVYRTEGKSTKRASWLLLIVFVAEIILIAAKINFNLARFLSMTEEKIGGYVVPLGDIKVVAPTIMAVLAIILFVRTRGRYTKWLAAIIFITSFAIVYALDPAIFSELLRQGIEEGLNQMR
jgi:membrane-associated HD superfamily phosphohydrolase